MVKLSQSLVEGRFIRRLNRFAALVEVSGQEEMVHVANSGRLGELLVPGFRMLLTPVAGGHRKCPYDLALVDLGFALTSADARLPNALFAEAVEQGRLSEFSGYPKIRREVVFGGSRLDLLLEGPGPSCYVETKSVTLVEDGIARFPDAPTTRGVKHLNHLARAVAAGHRAAVVFVIQRHDARCLQPHDTADPEFAAAFRQALAAGVEAFAHRCRVTHRQIKLAEEVPIKLQPLAVPD